MKFLNAKIGVAIALVLGLVGGIVTVVGMENGVGRTTIVGYFANSTGIYNGDDVVILGVPVGKVEKIEPEPQRVKITFWYNDKYKVPADAKAVVLSPSLVTPRSIQLTPAYTSGPALQTDAVIPQERTAVPVEWDDFRQQLEKLTQILQPTKPGGISTLGRIHQYRGRQLARPGARYPGYDHQALASDFRSGRSQWRPVQPR